MKFLLLRDKEFKLIQWAITNAQKHCVTKHIGYRDKLEVDLYALERRLQRHAS
jgi:hypothetical protein